MANDTILSCPICEYPKIRDCGNGLYRCDFCETYFDKDENIVQTEQEWLQTCDTEQLAWFIAKAMLFYDNTTMSLLDAIKKAMEYDKKASDFFTDDIVEWLKQPHTEKE